MLIFSLNRATMFRIIIHLFCTKSHSSSFIIYFIAVKKLNISDFQGMVFLIKPRSFKSDVLPI